MLTHAITQCPECKSKIIYFSTAGIKSRHNFTEATQRVHCANCEFTYHIVYTPDRIEEITS